MSQAKQKETRKWIFTQSLIERLSIDFSGLHYGPIGWGFYLILKVQSDIPEVQISLWQLTLTFRYQLLAPNIYWLDRPIFLVENFRPTSVILGSTYMNVSQEPTRQSVSRSCHTVGLGDISSSGSHGFILVHGTQATLRQLPCPANSNVPGCLESSPDARYSDVSGVGVVYALPHSDKILCRISPYAPLS